MTNVQRVALQDRALTAFLVLEVLILFVAAPLAGMGIHAPVLIGGMLVLPLVIAIVMISSSTGARLLAMLATALAIAGVLVRLSHPPGIGLWFGHGAVIAAGIAICWVIARAVFAPGRVTHHRIEGAVILYLNLAVIFGSADRLVAEVYPGAFGNVPPGQTEGEAASSMLYFSFTTLTATGFGEILPVHPIARSLANLETIVGQLYMAILLARLVTLHVEASRD